MSTVMFVTYVLAAGFWFVTAIYTLLASRAFIVEQFLQPRLFTPLAVFADWWAVLSIAVFALWAWPRRSWLADIVLANTTAAVLWVVAIIAAAVLGLPTGTAAAWICAGSMAMLWLLAASEQPSIRGASDTPSTHVTQDFIACVVAGLAYFAIEMANVAFRDGGAGVAAAAPGAARADALAAMVFFLVLAVVRGLAEVSMHPVVLEARLTVAAVGILAGWFLNRVALASISIGGAAAFLAAYVGGYVLATTLTTPAVVRLAEKTDGVRSIAGAFAPAFTRTPPGFMAWIAIAAAMAFGFDSAARVMDWNFVLARLGVLTVWLCVLAGAIRCVRLQAQGSGAIFIGAAFAVLAGHVALDRMAAPLSAMSPGTPASRWAADLMRRSEGSSELYSLLVDNTNITGDANGKPVDVSWTKLDGPPSATRPNVFLFIVDSLRRDYLSPYNERVTFTPAVSAFAKDSLVFERAFTQYGATGLSVPSIWTGGSILHKQYVTPFAPMNSLAKLLTHEQYDQWLSEDNIVDIIVPKTPAVQPLDAVRTVKDFRFCTTLDEVRERLQSRTSSAPLFVYSLPQDIHISVITREGSSSIDKETYEGFYAPVASRVRRWDGCFGAFVDDLKQRGLYDNSVIILTADHGDSLGEEGRMGHAYTIYPEIARIPMIVHVPPAIRNRFSWDLARPSYTTDLAPTLYRLLGHQVAPPGDVYGESLAGDPGAAARAPRDRMIASSYGAVYGAVVQSGTALFVADAIERRDMQFAIGQGPEPGRQVGVDAVTRREGTDVITRTVESLARAYQFAPR